ncbi:hypothetical protein [Streptomyces sp. TP-A0356]|uniref:hypothetical protein n=1 Tax=Streptomyces sp. TP-A0356 TaxID=1359208 RepID=UPI0006E29A67|nr:hypothetical protein [Streptomyces sp. TP-A0356]
MGWESLLGLGHLAGVAVALWTFNARAGGSLWRGVTLSVLAMSPEWTVTSVAKAVGWELTLIVWLLRGRPSSPWGPRPGSRTGRVLRLTAEERARRDAMAGIGGV